MTLDRRIETLERQTMPQVLPRFRCHFVESAGTPHGVGRTASVRDMQTGRSVERKPHETEAEFLARADRELADT